MEVSPKEKRNIKAIDRESVHRICSGQVVLSLAMAVKELVENSIDAGASIIEVKLKEYGSESVEVSDNGGGVRECDFESLTLKHHTSKLEDFSDLPNVDTFGFRGEALSSLCALGNLSVVTCHEDSNCGTRLEYDSCGTLVKKTPVARPVGTTVVVENLFSALPVRHKEFHRNLRKEFSKMVNLLTSYCLISTGKRIMCVNTTLKGKKTTILATNGDQTVKGLITCVLGSKQVNSLLNFTQLEPSEAVLEEFCLNTSVPFHIYSIEGYISSTAHGAGRSTADRQFFFINGRPCDLPKAAKIVNDIYHSYNKNQYPFICLNISVMKGSADINVTPDKRLIFMSEEKLLLAIIKTSILGMYEHQPLTIKNFAALNGGRSDKCSVSYSQSGSQVQDSPTLTNLKRSISDSLEGVEESKQHIKSVRLSDSFGFPVSSHSFEEMPAKDEIVMESDLTQCNDNEQSDCQGSPDAPTNDVEKCKNSRNAAVCQIATGSFKKQIENAVNNINFTATVPFKEWKVEDKVKMKCSRSSDSLLVKTFSKFTRDSVKVNNFCKEFSHSPSEVSSGKKVLRKKSKINSASESDCSNIDFLIQQHRMDLSNISRDTETYSDVQNNDEQHESHVVPGDGSPIDTALSMGSVTLNDGCISSEAIVHDDNDVVSELVSVDELCRRKKKVVVCEFSIDVIKNKLKRAEISQKSSQQCGYRKFRAQINADDAESELRKEISKETFTKMEIIGQFNLGFIITKLEEDLFIIDQHATDEKYNFEMLRRDTVLETQMLLNPQVLELTAASETTLLDNIQIFEKNGFKFNAVEDEKPGQRIQLLSVPVSQNWSFGKDDVDELIFMLVDNSGRMCRPSKVCKMFASRACRKSVMIGTPLSHQIMKKLVYHMSEIEHPWNCPHGRPTMRHLFSMNILNR